MSSASIDVALALHVLEHVLDDRKAMSEIARVLRPVGVAILQVPLSGRAIDEGVLNTPEERAARYEQADHARCYGDDFFTRLNESGLTWIAISPRLSMPAEAIAKYGLLPDEVLVFAVRSDTAFAVERLNVFGAMLRKGGLERN
jgi:SAM-dependent methyltransferase